MSPWNNHSADGAYRAAIAEQSLNLRFLLRHGVFVAGLRGAYSSLVSAGRIMPSRKILAGLFLSALLAGCAPDSGNERSAETTTQLVPKPAAPSPGPPTTLRVVMRIENGNVTVLSASPKRGNEFNAGNDVFAHRVIEDKSRALRYEILDASAAVIGSGLVAVPKVAVAEYLDKDVRHKIVREEQPLTSAVITTAIPYSPEARQLRFLELTPDAKLPVESWKATPLTTVDLPAANDVPPTGAVPTGDVQ
jgi:hypothetical protein